MSDAPAGQGGAAGDGGAKDDEAAQVSRVMAHIEALKQLTEKRRRTLVDSALADRAGGSAGSSVDPVGAQLRVETMSPRAGSRYLAENPDHYGYWDDVLEEPPEEAPAARRKSYRRQLSPEGEDFDHSLLDANMARHRARFRPVNGVGDPANNRIDQNEATEDSRGQARRSKKAKHNRDRFAGLFEAARTDTADVRGSDPCKNFMALQKDGLDDSFVGRQAQAGQNPSTSKAKKPKPAPRNSASDSEPSRTRRRRQVEGAPILIDSDNDSDARPLKKLKAARTFDAPSVDLDSILKKYLSRDPTTGAYLPAGSLTIAGNLPINATASVPGYLPLNPASAAGYLSMNPPAVSKYLPMNPPGVPGYLPSPAGTPESPFRSLSNRPAPDLLPNTIETFIRRRRQRNDANSWIAAKRLAPPVTPRPSTGRGPSTPAGSNSGYQSNYDLAFLDQKNELNGASEPVAARRSFVDEMNRQTPPTRDSGTARDGNRTALATPLISRLRGNSFVPQVGGLPEFDGSETRDRFADLDALEQNPSARRVGIPPTPPATVPRRSYAEMTIEELRQKFRQRSEELMRLPGVSNVSGSGMAASSRALALQAANSLATSGLMSSSSVFGTPRFASNFPTAMQLPTQLTSSTAPFPISPYYTYDDEERSNMVTVITMGFSVTAVMASMSRMIKEGRRVTVEGLLDELTGDGKTADVESVAGGQMEPSASGVSVDSVVRGTLPPAAPIPDPSASNASPSKISQSLAKGKHKPPPTTEQPPPAPSQNDAQLCVICLVDSPTHALIPCGHHILCDVCVKLELNECPICRTGKQGALRIFGA